MEFMDLINVEVIYQGTFNPISHGGKSIDITAQDIDDIVKTTTKFINETGNKPYIKLDHGNEQNNLPSILKAVSLGNLKHIYSDLREKGGQKVKTVVADFTGIPKSFYNMIKNGIAEKRSAEIRTYKNKWYLDALAFFGIGNPAVPLLNSLADEITAMREHDSEYLALSLTEDNQKTVIDLRTTTTKKNSPGVLQMDENVLLKQELDKLKSELQDYKNDKQIDLKISEATKPYIDKIGALEADLKKAEDEKASVQTKLDAQILLLKKQREQRWMDAVEKLIDDKKLEPAKKEMVIAQFKAFGENEELINAQLDLLGAREEDKRFKEVLSTDIQPNNDNQDAIEARFEQWKEKKLPVHLKNANDVEKYKAFIIAEGIQEV